MISLVSSFLKSLFLTSGEDEVEAGLNGEEVAEAASPFVLVKFVGPFLFGDSREGLILSLLGIDDEEWWLGGSPGILGFVSKGL